ncbi:hypothetical protein BGW41_003964 [Actinomortierella wolfii]|nr:hypothetical protein BGW41_003964 [Actinomortierella wolfii]
MMRGPADAKAKGGDLGKILLTPLEFESLEEIIKILEPAATFTDWVGGARYPAISQVYPKVHSMLPQIDLFKTEAAKQLHAGLDDFINDTWSLKSIPDAVLLATYLNPACAAYPMFDYRVTVQENRVDKECALRDKAMVLAKNEVIAHLMEETAGSEQVAPGYGSTSALEDAPPQVIVLQADFVVRAYDLMVQGNMKTEYANYLEAPQDYWRREWSNPRSNIRLLAPIAFKYLSIQATSSESERLFSKAGQVLSSRKARLSDNVFRNIVFSHSFDKLNALLDNKYI